MLLRKDSPLPNGGIPNTHDPGENFRNVYAQHRCPWNRNGRLWRRAPASPGRHHPRDVRQERRTTAATPCRFAMKAASSLTSDRTFPSPRITRIQELFAESVGRQYETIPIYAEQLLAGLLAASIRSSSTCMDCRKTSSSRSLPILSKSATLPSAPIRNYADWLYASFGKTFAESFPMQLHAQVSPTTAENMSTDWLGPRIYRAQP